MGSGDDPAMVTSAQEVHVGRRVELAQHPVDVERVTGEIDVEPLREHDLEDVALEDVLLRRLDCGLEVAARAVDAEVGEHGVAGGELLVGRRRRREVRERRRQGGDGGLEAVGGVVVGGRMLVGRRLGLEHHVDDERQPLGEVVERGHQARHAHHRIGHAVVVVGRVGEPLDLAHHVVAEVPDDAAVEGRQGVDVG